MRRGEAWRVQLPFSPGHQQARERPDLIVQRDSLIASLPTVPVVPFTSLISSARFAGTLIVSPDGRNGLTLQSVALVFQLCALDTCNCLKRLGERDAAILDKVIDLIDQLIR